MSNYEYEKQQAENRLHQRNLEQAAKATALAAQHAAQQAEMARIQQNASLRKQEKIAETNSFRTTVLGALSILDSEEKTKYIFQQISNRISNVENGIISIPKQELYNYTDINLISEKSAQAVFESVEYKKWQQIAIQYNTHLLTWNNEKEKYIKKFGPKDDEWVLKRTKLIANFKYPAIILVFLLFLTNDKFKKDDGLAITFFSIIAAIAWYAIRSITKPILESHMFISINNETYTQGIVNLKSKFESDINLKFKELNLTEKSAFEAVQKYFDEAIWGEIEKEQSFLPPNMAPKYEDWRNFLLNDRSISLNFSKVKNSLGEILKNAAVITDAPGISISH